MYKSGFRACMFRSKSGNVLKFFIEKKMCFQVHQWHDKIGHFFYIKKDDDDEPDENDGKKIKIFGRTKTRKQLDAFVFFVLKKVKKRK